MCRKKYVVPFISTILILSLFMGLTGIAAEDEETANIDIRGVEDDVEDRGNDGMLDFLTITVRVHVQNDDTYMIYGTLECPRSTFITTHNASYLPEGDGVLSLKFPGEKIYAEAMLRLR